MIRAQRGNIGTSVALLGLLAVVMPLSGCRGAVAGDLLTDGSGACATIALYYEDLAATVVDSWQNQSVFNALAGLAAPDGKPYEERLHAFQERATLAHAAGAVYDGLKQLRDPSGAAKVKTAGEGLGQAIQSTGKLPGSSKAVTDELGEVAAFLSNLQSQRDLKRAMKAMVSFHAGLQTVFASEEPTYLSVNEERTGTSEHLLEALAKKKLVKPESLLQGLHVGLPVTTTADDTTQAAGLAMAKLAVERANLSWQCATEQVSAILTSLSDLAREAQRGQATNLRVVEDQMGRANACLKERDDIVKGKS